MPAWLALAVLLAPALAACQAGEPDARALYRAHCARCHAGDGKGDPRSVGLYPNLDLLASPLVLAGSRGRGLMFQRISEGYGAMPGFGHHLETEQIQSLIDYILRLAQGKA